MPVTGVRYFAPLIHLLTEQVDQRSGIVLLLRRRKPLALVENDLLLNRRLLPLFRLRDGRDVLGETASRDDLVRRLAARVELPVAAGIAVGRVENRLFEKRLLHVLVLKPPRRPARSGPGLIANHLLHQSAGDSATLIGFTKATAQSVSRLPLSTPWAE